MGVCVSIPYVLPDAMLGDIIDYDELLTGDRNEVRAPLPSDRLATLVGPGRLVALLPSACPRDHVTDHRLLR